jgi:hypothetical protein
MTRLALVRRRRIFTILRKEMVQFGHDFRHTKGLFARETFHVYSAAIDLVYHKIVLLRVQRWRQDVKTRWSRLIYSQ